MKNLWDDLKTQECFQYLNNDNLYYFVRFNTRNYFNSRFWSEITLDWLDVSGIEL